jgi:hypothetical protein
MSRNIGMLAALAVCAAACTDQPAVTTPGGVPETTSVALARPQSPDARGENLARLVARALADSGFRAYLRTSLQASPFREQKLHFQRLLGAANGQALSHIARANDIAKDAVAREAASAEEFEIYLPVPAHRASWTGDSRVLVATARSDHEAPVAFDPRGRRTVLSPETPPETPVIALVPVETDFDRSPHRAECIDCGGEGGYVPPPPPSPPPGLYMTKAHFIDDFESWLKGSPEIEAHILGQKGQTDSLTSYQCAGQHAGGPYVFDQNGKDWSGNVMLFSAAQISGYNTTHPNQNFRVFFVEDDDTACQIRANRDLVTDFIMGIDGAYKGLTAGNDSTNSFGKQFKAAAALLKLWSAATSLIKTNDDLIGNAVEDDVVGLQYPGYNWIVKGRNAVTNGWVNLVIR